MADADIKSRRKALGWTRQELAERAGIDKFVLQQIEMGSWNEGEARVRVDTTLERAEAGELDVRLERIAVPDDGAVLSPGTDDPSST
ncbi:MAG: helix-turn-helix transcriptional regulator [Myxococcota bacterium]